MKIFAIRDESSQEQEDRAYLLYYEQEKRFYIELPENADAWETPLLLDSFVKRGETTVNSYWSRIWVEQRIVPPDRQNIGEILRDNHLKEYDEYALLMLAMGRCAQDDYYLVPIDEKELPEEFTKRFSKRIEDVLPLEDLCVFKEVPRQWMTQMLEAARLSPSSMNSQPWRFVVYDNRIHIFSKKHSVEKLRKWDEVNFGIMFANMMVAAEELWLDVDLIRLGDISQKNFSNNQYVLSAILKA